MKINVDTVLSCGTRGTIDLPVRSWKSVKGWYVKWDTFRYTTDGKNWKGIELNSWMDEIIDWKRPMSAHVSNAKTKETIASYEG